MLDQYFEEIHADLLMHFGVDIVQVIAGGVAMTPPLILGLLRRLPEGSHYGASIAANAPEAEEQAPSTEPVTPDPAHELRTWTHDRMLMAQLINSVNMLVRYSINWDKDKAPTLPIVGPASWRGEGKAAKPKPISVRDAFKRLTGK